MYSHFDSCLVTSRHQCFKEILEIFPQRFLIHILIHFEKLLQMSHSFRLPARHGITLAFAKYILSHLFGILLDLILLIIESCRSIRKRMEKICPGPVKNRHEVVAYNLYSELRKITESLLVILYIEISVRACGLNVVMYIYRLNDFHTKTVFIQFILNLLYLFLLPNLSGLFIMKSPNYLFNSGDLLDIGE